MEYFAKDWEKHVMGPSSGQTAFVEFEDLDSEIAAIDGAIRALNNCGILPSTEYDHHKFDLFKESVKSNFEIPWTGISPRMRRMIYSINAIYRPDTIICAGIFCGYTFICNVGASIGPGSCYKSKNIIGLEILSREAERAANNLERFSSGSGLSVICADAADWLSRQNALEIDLLYIDAKSIDFDPTKEQQKSKYKSEYLKILESALSCLKKGSIVLAHNSVNAADTIHDYLSIVRSEKFHKSINLIIDDAGLEASIF